MDQLEPRPSPAAERPRSAQLKTYGICLLAGLLIGLIPTGVAVIQTRGELETVQRQLRVADLELSLSSAAVLARHGRLQRGARCSEPLLL